jgi:hypothetical protein
MNDVRSHVSVWIQSNWQKKRCSTKEKVDRPTRIKTKQDKNVLHAAAHDYLLFSRKIV